MLRNQTVTSSRPNRNRPPGPRGLPIVGVLPYVRRDSLRFYLATTRRYGDIAYLGRGFYAINNPSYIKYILQDHNSNYVKGGAIPNLKLLVGEGLLTSEGGFWRRQRRLAQPAFHRQRLGLLAATMTDATVEMLERWQTFTVGSQPFDVAAEMIRLTLNIVSRTLFSTDMSGDTNTVRRALPTSLKYVRQRSLSAFPPPTHWPLPSNLRFQQARRALDAIVYRVIEERRCSGRDHGDLLSMLMLATDEETGEAMDDRQLRDEVMTIFLAGHETTANALSWTFYLLSLHPDIERRMHAEVVEVLGDRTPTVDDLSRLSYTRQVLDESMRLYPPAWLISRSPIQDDEIGGYTIPAGETILISPYTMHRNPAYWDNPEGFDPERFTPEKQAARPRFAYFPFGGGPRICIGNNFALMESQLILAMISQRYRLHLVSGHPVAPQTMITLRPRYGILMTLHQR
ncbi:MAG: cytochrome P450 [Chloroflexales bacterium]|nr:cytochrome P450 [Chloroflexales bacterium]